MKNKNTHTHMPKLTSHNLLAVIKERRKVPTWIPQERGTLLCDQYSKAKTCLFYKTGCHRLMSVVKAHNGIHR